MVLGKKKIKEYFYDAAQIPLPKDDHNPLNIHPQGAKVIGLLDLRYLGIKLNLHVGLLNIIEQLRSVLQSRKKDKVWDFLKYFQGSSSFFDKIQDKFEKTKDELDEAVKRYEQEWSLPEYSEKLERLSRKFNTLNKRITELHHIRSALDEKEDQDRFLTLFFLMTDNKASFYIPEINMLPKITVIPSYFHETILEWLISLKSERFPTKLQTSQRRLQGEFPEFCWMFFSLISICFTGSFDKALQLSPRKGKRTSREKSGHYKRYSQIQELIHSLYLKENLGSYCDFYQIEFNYRQVWGIISGIFFEIREKKMYDDAFLNRKIKTILEKVRGILYDMRYYA